MGINSKKKTRSPSKQVLDETGISSKKNKAEKKASSRKKGFSRGVKVTRVKFLDYEKKVPLPDSAVPEGMPKATVLSHVVKLVDEKEATNGKLTTNTAMGRFWEFSFLKIFFVKKHIAAYLKISLEMLEEFRQKYHDDMGFLNGDGAFEKISAKDLAILDRAISQLKDATLMNMEAMKKSGLVYVDSFKIGSTQFKDGAFVLMLESHYIVLVNMEAKTKFSGGIIAQLATYFVRLAAAKQQESMSFLLDGKTVKIGREKLLFNPMWLDAQLGVKEAEVDRVNQFSRRVSQEFSRRVGSQKKRIVNTPADQRNKFDKVRTRDADEPPIYLAKGNNLARLAVGADVIYSETNLRALRAYIEAFIESLRREQNP